MDPIKLCPLQRADRITVLDAGEIVAQGLPGEILSNPRVRGLFAGAPPDMVAHA